MGGNRNIKHKLTDTSELQDGDRVGLLLSLDDGSVSVVRAGRVVGYRVITGVVGPVVPCIRIFSVGKAVRIHGELEVGMLAFDRPEPPDPVEVVVDPNAPVMVDDVCGSFEKIS